MEGDSLFFRRIKKPYSLKMDKILINYNVGGK